MPPYVACIFGLIMKREIELLAPGGDVDAIKAAILAGADAIYCGLDKFNARNRAANISFDNLLGILYLAHQHDCEIFITLNVVVVDAEVTALIKLLNKLVNTAIDGVIVQDLGMLYLLKTYFPSLKVHASTQLTTHNKGQVAFLQSLHITRVNLSRELNIQEIKELTTYSHSCNMLTEVFVHGSNCISFSGLCLMSSLHGGNSGNRGRCSQPCRDQYETTAMGKSYPLNLKDNSAFNNLPALYEAGVDSLKIEGRIKKLDYVYTVVNTWRKHINNYYKNSTEQSDGSALRKVFNRDFSNAFLTANIHKEMFIDSPRDNSIKHLQISNTGLSKAEITQKEIGLLKEQEQIKQDFKNKVNKLRIDKVPLQIFLSGTDGQPLKVSLQTPDMVFEISSKINLSSHGNEPLTYQVVFKKLKAINDTHYVIDQINLGQLGGNVFLPFKELSLIKSVILFELNGRKKAISPVQLPKLKKTENNETHSDLMILISSFTDMHWAKEEDCDVYFQLPNSLGERLNDYIDFFKNNPQVIAYFPAILIGKDYNDAITFLESIHAKLIVSNNTGIAQHAFEHNIKWIAGPELTTTNSYTLLCLKEYLNCAGAFISNELSEGQIRRIVKPDNFKLYFSVYHPIKLMTTRQCMFHQVTGCAKHKLDASCISKCEKHTSITNLKKQQFIIEKSAGNYHCLYNSANYLNTEIISNPCNDFNGYLLDVRIIEPEIKIKSKISDLIRLIKELASGNTNIVGLLKEKVQPTTSVQYQKGI